MGEDYPLSIYVLVIKDYSPSSTEFGVHSINIYCNHGTVLDSQASVWWKLFIRYWLQRFCVKKDQYTCGHCCPSSCFLLSLFSQNSSGSSIFWSKLCTRFIKHPFITCLKTVHCTHTAVRQGFPSRTFGKVYCTLKELKHCPSNLVTDLSLLSTHSIDKLQHGKIDCTHTAEDQMGDERPTLKGISVYCKLSSFYSSQLNYCFQLIYCLHEHSVESHNAWVESANKG